MIPFILLDRNAQTAATVDLLREIRDLLNITEDISTDEIIARVGDLNNFLGDRLLLDDTYVTERRESVGRLQSRVLPTFKLGIELTTFRTQLRLFLTRNRSFTYGFDQQLIDTVTFATFLPTLPDWYLGSLHYATVGERAEHSEYLYESIQNVHDLLTHMRALTA